jgi:integrase
MRSEVRSVTQPEPSIPDLPKLAHTRGGVVFDPLEDRWSYREGVKTVSLEFGAIPALSKAMALSLKRVLLWYAENASTNHLQNMHFHFVRFARFLESTGKNVIDQIASTDLLNYKASLTEDKAWYLSALSGLLARWHRLGIPGVAGDAAELLGELRLKGNPHGVAVMTMDPVRGPFTNIEQEAIQAALHEAFANGSIDEGTYLLAWLLMALGARPAQYAALKVCDLTRSTSKEGDLAYTLRVPRVKQRRVNARGEFTERALIPQIGELLFAYAQQIRSTFAGAMEDPDQAPLFPATSQQGRKVSPPGFEFHDTAEGLSKKLSAALNALEVPSERIGGSLNVTPIRFRRTFGTRAAQEGHGELVIAELLDHSDTQHVGVYVASVPEIAERIDRAIAMQLAPLAQAFAGVLIENESQATRAGDPTSRIVDLRTDQKKPMGSCGQHSFCSFNAPIACYTCKNFEPWLDGPHEALLERLLAERDRLMVTTDKRIAATNDRTILAVAEVVQLCQEALERAAAGNG